MGNKFDLIPYDKTGKKADFEKRPLDIPTIQPKKSQINHITFKKENLTILIKEAIVKYDYQFTDKDDKKAFDKTKWMKVKLIQDKKRMLIID
ncbi:MAG: hypothetical protein ACTSPM_06985 [Candidatus Heimdallarchaeota archaeon]